MALIKCRECGKEVSHTAEICPNCGAESPQLSENAYQVCKNRQAKKDFWDSNVGSVIKLGIAIFIIMIVIVLMIITNSI